MRQQPRCTRRGTLRYDPTLDRFLLDVGDDTSSLHCGQSLGLRMGTRYVWGRIEMDRSDQWYVIFAAPGGPATTFTLRRRCRYPAKVYW